MLSSRYVGMHEGNNDGGVLHTFAFVRHILKTPLYLVMALCLCGWDMLGLYAGHIAGRRVENSWVSLKSCFGRCLVCLPEVAEKIVKPTCVLHSFTKPPAILNDEAILKFELCLEHAAPEKRVYSWLSTICPHRCVISMTFRFLLKRFQWEVVDCGAAELCCIILTFR